jgi:hypothetical protein
LVREGELEPDADRRERVVRLVERETHLFAEEGELRDPAEGRRYEQMALAILQML